MELTYRLTTWDRIRTALWHRFRSPLFFIATGLAFGLFTWQFSELITILYGRTMTDLTILIVAMLITAGCLWLGNVIEVVAICYVKEKRASTEESTVAINAFRLMSEQGGRREIKQWYRIQRIDQNRHYIYIYDNTPNVFIIPKRSFASRANVREFFEQLQQFWQDGQRELPAVHAS